MRSLRLLSKGDTTLHCNSYIGWNKQGNEHNEQEHQYLGVTERMKAKLPLTVNTRSEERGDWSELLHNGREQDSNASFIFQGL